MRYSTRNKTHRNKKKLKGAGISLTESLTVKRINMVEKSTLLTMCGHKTVRLCFSMKIQTKLKLSIVIFFWAMSQTNYGEKKCAVSIVILLRSFLLVFGVFYILTHYFYQILGKASLIVKIHHENILFLSTITKQYFFFGNFYHHSLKNFLQA